MSDLQHAKDPAKERCQTKSGVSWRDAMAEWPALARHVVLCEHTLY